MDYAARVAKKEPIESGVTESACNQLTVSFAVGIVHDDIPALLGVRS